MRASGLRTILRKNQGWRPSTRIFNASSGSDTRAGSRAATSRSRAGTLAAAAPAAHPGGVRVALLLVLAAVAGGACAPPPASRLHELPEWNGTVTLGSAGGAPV